MATNKAHAETNTGTAHMERAVVCLQGIKDGLEEAANYFESLGMTTQAEDLDEAHGKVEDVWELLECLLGRVELDGGFGGFGDVKPAKKPAKKSATRRQGKHAPGKRPKVAA